MSNSNVAAQVTVDDAILTAAQRSSRQWIAESVALTMLGLSARRLQELRRLGEIRALPERRGPGGSGRDFFYFARDVQAHLRKRTSYIRASHGRNEEGGSDGRIDRVTHELELAMAHSARHQAELAQIRAEHELQVRVLENDNAALRGEVAHLIGMVEADVARLRTRFAE